MQRAVITCFTVLVALMGVGRPGNPAAPDAARRPVRVMINWDEQSLWRAQLTMRQRNNQPLDAPSVQQVLETAVDEHARAGVDRMVYCAWARFASPVPGFKSCEYDKSIVEISPGFDKLHAAGTDQVAILLDRCRQRGMQFLVCLRMNDRHGAAQKAKFYVENPQLRLAGYPGGLDYKYQEVRAGVLAFIKEVLDRYDVDGIELDYLRWCHMFRSEEAASNAHLLTEMTRRARALVDAAAKKRGRKKLLLSARVPQTFAECQRLGFDITTWVQEGLLDYICPSDFFHADFNMRVARFVELCRGTECKVFPAIHPLIQVNHPDNITLENYRALARSYYAAGADGIATYNYQYNWRRWTGGDRGLADGWPKTLAWMGQLRDPEDAAINAKPRHYLFYPLWQIYSPSGAVKYERIVFARQDGKQGDALTFLLYEQNEGTSRKVVMQFRALGLGPDDQLAIAVNGHPVSDAAVGVTFDKDGRGPREGRPCGPFHLHQFSLPQEWLKPGENRLAVHLARQSDQGGKEIVVKEIEVRVE